MHNIIHPRAHTIIGGLASQYQGPLTAQLVFEQLAEASHPQAVLLCENEGDGQQFRTAASQWSAANHRKIAPEQIQIVADFRLKGSASAVISAIEERWNHRPLILVRDASGHTMTLPPTDRWFREWAPELQRTFNCTIVTSIATGNHRLNAEKLTNYSADAVWSCETSDSTLTAKQVTPAAGRMLEFEIRHGLSTVSFHEMENANV